MTAGIHALCVVYARNAVYGIATTHCVDVCSEGATGGEWLCTPGRGMCGVGAQ